MVGWWEVKNFLKFLAGYLIKRGTEFLEQFEAGKGVVVEGLVAKRGRYTRPFLHTGMTGLFLVGLLLAPVITQAVGEDPNAASGKGGLSVQAGVILGMGADSLDTTTSVSIKPRDSVVIYLVQSGDTISSIANKFDVSIDTLRWQNDLKSIDAIKPGDKLEVPPVTGMIHKVKRGETIFSIAKKYDVTAQQIINWPFNSYADDETFELAAGQVLVVPDGVKPAEILWDPKRYVAQTTPNAGAVSATGQFIWPAGGTISQRYVWYHRGIDIANKSGPLILAADSGKVTMAGWPDAGGYGNRVMIDHGNGFQTLYAHLSGISVTAGQTVNRGDVIGRMGSTGRSTGTHLHFEIRTGGSIVNPLEYLK
ncbi:MAG: Peptidase M23 family protein [Candidatus Beckwithbacteria bacterium GW2011_GWA2_43_10]|uniref:Peptidase M23 family protein n=1 Tax=Candidatus Beckwithbacteria bacterium GW2011_GWA2_43_10 TaxID=1618369 RepID=A0A0G1EX75_9BACT|nr:MAG: Peptidase M23 family protein [Candidatus Beckwithbacteria bacterium GW2011_GWA2_43_10]